MQHYRHVVEERLFGTIRDPIPARAFERGFGAHGVHERGLDYFLGGGRLVDQPHGRQRAFETARGVH